MSWFLLRELGQSDGDRRPFIVMELLNRQVLVVPVLSATKTQLVCVTCMVILDVTVICPGTSPYKPCHLPDVFRKKTPFICLHRS